MTCRKNRINPIIGLLLWLSILSCNAKHPDKQTLIETELARRTREFFEDHQASCTEQLMTEAEMEALERIRQDFRTMHDTSMLVPDFPHKPLIIKREVDIQAERGPLFKEK